LWDYLIVTAANAQQAAAYEAQIRIRGESGSLPQVRHAMVVSDAGGRRVGSGGSTIQCLQEVLRAEGAQEADEAAVLRRLRILIVHAGGDSRRLPAYSPCGKIFVPLPGDTTLFDRLVPAFLRLPEGPPGGGQIVVAAGDALILFDPAEVDFSRPGLIALAARATPEEAARHGVLCPEADGSVRLYLQKPAIGEQARNGAIDSQGRAALDIGVMSLDAAAAAAILRTFSTPSAQNAITSYGIDLYREICCALGSEATFEHYRFAARASGSPIDDALLTELYRGLRNIPLSLQTLSRCDFLHFGSSRQLISSGIALVPSPGNRLLVNSEVSGAGRVDGTDCWVEGCRVRAPLTLHGRNVIVGGDVEEPFKLPGGGCLDVSYGSGKWFIRYYGIDDTFKSANFRGKLLPDWLQDGERILWDAPIFPAETDPRAYRKWLWMLDMEHATSDQKRQLLAADRYSSAQIALLVDHAAFHARRKKGTA
jgi:fucokinase